MEIKFARMAVRSINENILEKGKESGAAQDDTHDCDGGGSGGGERERGELRSP